MVNDKQPIPSYLLPLRSQILSMKSIVLLTGLLISLFSFAQPGRGGQQMTGRFYGRIVDVSNRGIEAASVVLVQQKRDSVTKQISEVVVGGMLTAPNGDFSIENVPAMGRYQLKVTGIGYKEHVQELRFEMDRNDPNGMLYALDKDLGNIQLAIDEKLLSGVTVTATRPGLTMGIDRKVFNVDKNLVSAGGTAVDVMKNVPSVNVDIDGNVTLRNNAPQIFVDGRPTNMTLEQIPADAIESIEIITNPSAKFDASGGTSGILNIVLKKQKRVGYAGNLRANIDSRAKFGLGGDINVRQGKINVFGNANYRQMKSLSEGFTSRLTYDSIPVNSMQVDDNEFEGRHAFARAGVDFFLNNRNTLSFTGSMADGRMDPTNSSIIRVNEDHTFADTVRRSDRATNSNNKFRNKGAQISFKHNFPKAGNEWTADFNYHKGENENRSRITTNNYLEMPGDGFQGVYVQSQNGSGKNERMVFQTDYANPISKNSKFEVGARSSIFKLNNFTNIVIGGKTSTTTYQNEDRVLAAYGTFSNRIKEKFGYQLGLRAESSTNEGILNNKDKFRTEFPISFFPSAFISQKLSEVSDLQLNYSRRINRPNFFQLFPFTDYSDSFNISRGNPGLDPEFTNSLELSFSTQFKNRDNFIASVYFKNTNDLITRFQGREFDTFLKRTVFVNSYINANRQYVTGLELTSRNNLAKWWDLTTNANFFTSKIDLENQPDPDQFLSYFFKINNTFRLPHNFTIQLSGDYQSKTVSSPGGSGGGGGHRGGGGPMFGGGGGSASQGYNLANYGVDAGLRFEFLKNKAASLSLNVNDIFRTKKFGSHSEGFDQNGNLIFIQDSERRRDAQVVRLNFNYRFGKFDATLFKRKNTREEPVDSGMGL